MITLSKIYRDFIYRCIICATPSKDKSKKCGNCGSTKFRHKDRRRPTLEDYG